MKTKELYTTWAQDFLRAKTKPMTKDESTAFTACCMFDLQPDSPSLGLENTFQYQVLDKRAKFVSLNLSEGVKAFLCSICDNPGVLVMYVYALRHLQVSRSLERISILELAQTFQAGFPTEEELHRLWDAQKLEGQNMLDILSVEDLS